MITGIKSKCIVCNSYNCNGEHLPEKNNSFIKNNLMVCHGETTHPISESDTCPTCRKAIENYQFIQEMLDAQKKALLAEIDDKLPSISKHICRFNDNNEQCECFVECLIEVRQVLNKLIKR